MAEAEAAVEEIVEETVRRLAAAVEVGDNDGSRNLAEQAEEGEGEVGQFPEAAAAEQAGEVADLEPDVQVGIGVGVSAESVGTRFGCEMGAEAVLAPVRVKGCLQQPAE